MQQPTELLLASYESADRCFEAAAAQAAELIVSAMLDENNGVKQRTELARYVLERVMGRVGVRAITDHELEVEISVVGDDFCSEI